MMSIRGLLIYLFLVVPTPFAMGDVISFGDLTLSSESNWHGSASGGTTVPGEFGDVTVGSFESGGAQFVNRYIDGEVFDSWNGFAYSNEMDTMTAGFGNQYSVMTGSDHSADNDIFGVASGYDALTPNDADSDPFDPTSAADLRALPTFRLPADSVIEGMFVTNTTYAALSMLNGDGFAKKFGGAGGNDSDWFKITAYGIDALGNPLSTAVEFYLADYRFGDSDQDYVLDDWAYWDLTTLANARSVHFNLSSSDVGNFGMNTPSYFAVDDIQIAAVPEPSSLLLLGGSLLAGGVWGGQRRRKRSK